MPHGPFHAHQGEIGTLGKKRETSLHSHITTLSDCNEVSSLKVIIWVQRSLYFTQLNFEENKKREKIHLEKRQAK